VKADPQDNDEKEDSESLADVDDEDDAGESKSPDDEKAANAGSEGDDEEKEEEDDASKGKGKRGKGKKPKDEKASESEGSEYEVEKILDKRTKKGGQVDYLLKWRGYDEPTWETAKNVFCTDLVKQFEDSLLKEKAKKGTPGGKRKEPTGGKGKVDKRRKQKAEDDDSKVEDLKVGFEHGDEVLDIIGARMEDELLLFVSWDRKPDPPMTFIPARIANEKIPQKVIAFYESRLKFDQPKEAI